MRHRASPYRRIQEFLRFTRSARIIPRRAFRCNVDSGGFFGWGGMGNVERRVLRALGRMAVRRAGECSLGIDKPFVQSTGSDAVMQISKSQVLRLGITAGVVLLVGWGMWQCQDGHRLLDCRTFYPSDYFHTSEYGWPMFHTYEIVTGDVFVPRSARYDRTPLFPGVLVDPAVWCLVLIATGCVAWQWTAHSRQWGLRTLFWVSVVVAVLLGWWRWEHDIATGPLPAGYIKLFVCRSRIADADVAAFSLVRLRSRSLWTRMRHLLDRLDGGRCHYRD